MGPAGLLPLPNSELLHVKKRLELAKLLHVFCAWLCAKQLSITFILVSHNDQIKLVSSLF